MSKQFDSGVRIPKLQVAPDGQRAKQAVDPFSYPADPLDVSSFPSGIPPKPRYEDLIDWLTPISGRSVSLDYWARGNYARRLIHNKLNGTRPLLVPVQFVDEIRWAYRRLALLGVPVEFLWRGSLSRPVKVFHLHPADGDSIWDAGWGYLAAGGQRARLRGRQWSMISGYARLMPEIVADWIAEEVPAAFGRGDIFVTPEELVGLSTESAGIRTEFERLVGSLSFRSARVEEALLSLELPALDGMRPAEFERLLTDSPVELERFRTAFRRLIEASSAANLESLVAELNYEVSELTLAAKYHRFRTNVTRLGGVVGTTAATIGSAVGATSGLDPAALAAAGGGAAVAGLCEYIRQAAERGFELRRNPFHLLWNLGSRKPFQVHRQRGSRHKWQKRSGAPLSINDEYFHWLAPPTAGVGFLALDRVQTSETRQ